MLYLLIGITGIVCLNVLIAGPELSREFYAGHSVDGTVLIQRRVWQTKGTIQRSLVIGFRRKSVMCKPRLENSPSGKLANQGLWLIPSIALRLNRCQKFQHLRLWQPSPDWYQASPTACLSVATVPNKKHRRPTVCSDGQGSMYRPRHVSLSLDQPKC